MTGDSRRLRNDGLHNLYCCNSGQWAYVGVQYKCRPPYRCAYVAGIHLRLRVTKYWDILLFVRYSAGLHVSDAK